ncbi:MAG: GNAT family N-acetyltransferase [Oscillospiraceae bacterium]|nr:GNAT family N-acetyltransferase [Oscillospiraceae bacterium]
MSEILTRNPRTDEVPLLKNLWSFVFGDIGIDAFFRLFFKPELCLVVEQNSSLAAMGYLIPSGDIKTVSNAAENEKFIKCAMIYSVGTLPEYRSIGLGTIIVNNLITLAGKSGYDAVVLCPSEDRLFEYYINRTKLRDWFYVNERLFSNLTAGNLSLIPVEISIDEYIAFREKLLSEVVHMRLDEHLFQYQLDLCKEFGGGLYRIGNSCAVIERQSGGNIWIKELLMPDTGKSIPNGNLDDADINKFLSSIAHIFPADEYLVRTPVKSGSGRRFGMLNLCGRVQKISADNDFAPWYGVAFD